MIPLVTQLFAIFGPIAVKIYEQYASAHAGQPMTDAQLIAEFNRNIDAILAEGAAWTAAHPSVHTEQKPDILKKK